MTALFEISFDIYIYINHSSAFTLVLEPFGHVLSDPKDPNWPPQRTRPKRCPLPIRNVEQSISQRTWKSTVTSRHFSPLMTISWARSSAVQKRFLWHFFDLTSRSLSPCSLSGLMAWTGGTGTGCRRAEVLANWHHRPKRPKLSWAPSRCGTRHHLSKIGEPCSKTSDHSFFSLYIFVTSQHLFLTPPSPVGKPMTGGWVKHVAVRKRTSHGRARGGAAPSPCTPHPLYHIAASCAGVCWGVVQQEEQTCGQRRCALRKVCGV